MRKKRLLVFALDGADPLLLERFRQEGVVSFLPSVIQDGFGGILESTLPPATYPAWASFLTGMNPGRHGVFDFFRKGPGWPGISLMDSASIRGRSMMEALSRHGKKALSAFVPLTYPPFPIKGAIVAGFDSPLSIYLPPRSTYPPGLHGVLAERFGRIPFAGFGEVEKRGGWDWEERSLALLKSGIEKKGEIARFLMKMDDFDLFIFHFGEIDTASHHFWAFHDPESPRFLNAPAAVKGALPEIYRRIDDVAGAIWEEARNIGFTHILFLSDHGFRGSGRGVFFINRYLEEGGFLRFKETEGGGLKIIRKGGLRYLPAPLLQSLMNMPLLGRMGLFMEGAHRTIGVDIEKSLAFSWELNYAPSVILNLRGRGRKGVVAGGWAFQRVAEEVRSHLLNARGPAGERVFEEALPKGEIYSGEYSPLSPDIILVPALNKGCQYNFLRSEGGMNGGPFSSLAEGDFRGGKGKGMNGVHFRYGVWGLSGEGVKGGDIVNLRIWDTFPLVMTILSCPVPPCDGLLPQEILESGIGRYEKIKEGWEPIRERSRGFTAAESKRLLMRLKGTGYL